jgi:hypothetical protein
MPNVLESAAAEIEAHVGYSGWDQRPALFALVQAAQFVADEPQTAARLGVEAGAGAALTPIEQEPMPDGPLDEALAQIGWPESVAGCALAQEIVILPPSVEATLDEQGAASVGAHPQRREARLVVAVLRDGSSAAVLRLRAVDGAADTDLLTGPDLAPTLARALVDTLT